MTLHSILTQQTNLWLSGLAAAVTMVTAGTAVFLGGLSPTKGPKVAVTDQRPGSVTHQAHPASRLRRWPISYYFAALGAVFLFFEAWTLAAWLADGPKPVTKFQDLASTDASAARVFEILAVLFAIGMAIYVVRQCIRERRLTFDAMFCIMGCLLYWVDPFANWLQPVFYYSSNWVNLKSWCSYAPFVVNPDCSRLPEPVLFLGCLYTFGFLGFVMALNKGMGLLKRRRPDISAVKLIGITFIGGMVIDFLLEGPMVAFKLWFYPGWPLSFTGEQTRYPFFELVIASILWTGIAAVRYFKNDRGETLAERGMDRSRPGTKAIVTILALIGMSQGLAVVSNTILITHGPFMQQYPAMPAWLVNDMCNAPGVTGTRYGPCPGDAHYLAPLRRLPDPAQIAVTDHLQGK